MGDAPKGIAQGSAEAAADMAGPAAKLPRVPMVWEVTSSPDGRSSHAFVDGPSLAAFVRAVVDGRLREIEVSIRKTTFAQKGWTKLDWVQAACLVSNAFGEVLDAAAPARQDAQAPTPEANLGSPTLCCRCNQHRPIVGAVRVNGSAASGGDMKPICEDCSRKEWPPASPAAPAPSGVAPLADRLRDLGTTGLCNPIVEIKARNCMLEAAAELDKRDEARDEGKHMWTEGHVAGHGEGYARARRDVAALCERMEYAWLDALLANDGNSARADAALQIRGAINSKLAAAPPAPAAAREADPWDDWKEVSAWLAESDRAEHGGGAHDEDCSVCRAIKRLDRLSGSRAEGQS